MLGSGAGAGAGRAPGLAGPRPGSGVARLYEALLFPYPLFRRHGFNNAGKLRLEELLTGSQGALGSWRGRVERRQSWKEEPKVKGGVCDT